MYKKILVPLDGSKLAEKSLAHAESLAETYHAKIILLSVVESPAIAARTPADMDLFQESLDRLREEMEIYLRGKKGELAGKHIQTEILVGHGPVVGKIVDVAEKYPVDLVIIASHGHTGLKRVFYGSVTAGVLNRIRKPLLVIRSSEE